MYFSKRKLNKALVSDDWIVIFSINMCLVIQYHLYVVSILFQYCTYVISVPVSVPFILIYFRIISVLVFRTVHVPYMYLSVPVSVLFMYWFHTFMYGKVSFSVSFIHLVYYLKFRMFCTVYNVPFPYLFFHRADQWLWS